MGLKLKMNWLDWLNRILVILAGINPLGFHHWNSLKAGFLSGTGERFTPHLFIDAWRNNYVLYKRIKRSIDNV